MASSFNKDPHPEERNRISDSAQGVAGVTAIDPHPRTKHRGLRVFGIILVVVLAVAAVVGVAGYTTYQMGLWGDVSVPDVYGMELDQAKQVLFDADLECESVLEKTDGGYGTVCSMDPDAQTDVRHGSTVVVGIADKRIVPDVVGMKTDDAQAALKEEGLADNIVIEQRVSLDENQDTVLEISPHAGSVAKSSDTITLYIAQTLQIPDVVGKKQKKAIAQMEALGLVPSVEWRESNESYPTVVETDPLAGTRVDEGSPVTIYVANGGPRDRWHLLDYFDSKPKVVARYLEWAGWEFAYSRLDEEGKLLQEVWYAGDDVIVFGSDPFTEVLSEWWQLGPTESQLAQGKTFDCVRMNLLDLSDDVPDEKTAQKYMSLCGFDNPQDTCTNKDISLPKKKMKLPQKKKKRVCVYGITNAYTWVVLAKDDGDGSSAVSLFALRENQVAQLIKDGGSVCDLVMYSDAVQASNE